MSKEYESNSKRLLNLNEINAKTIISLASIGIAGFVIRLFFVPFNIPIILDGTIYFWYGIDMSVLKEFPVDYDLTNNLWPTILSVFFSVFHSNDYLDYMNLQRTLSMVFSVLTIVPVYLLCRRFFSSPISLIGASLFAFEPRVIHNSILGITEPMFVFVGATCIYLFLSPKKNTVLISFILVGILSLIRYEGFLLVIPMLIIFYFKFRNESKILLNCFIAISLFMITIAPMTIIKMETMGYDGIFSHLGSGINVVSKTYTADDVNENKFFPVLGIINFVKTIGWVLIPTFILFIPFGLFLFLKKMDLKIKTLIIMAVFSAITAFYAYSRGILDTRYFLILYPIFIIVSLYSINWFNERYQKKYVMYLLIAGLIISSFIFLDIKTKDQYDTEAYEIALKNADNLKVINDLNPESAYYRIVALNELDHFPVLREEVAEKIKLIRTDEYEIVEDFIKQNEENGLTHIIVDDRQNRKQFLHDILINEDNYRYLTKIYDSESDDYSYRVKIFEVNYEKFKEMNP